MHRPMLAESNGNFTGVIRLFSCCL